MTDAPHARLATLEQLLQSTIPALLSPPPSRHTLRAWFDRARVPRFKTNPSAIRGGGPVFYSIPAVERLIQSRVLSGRIVQPIADARHVQPVHEPPAVV
jgi:hypothetical protein